MKSLMTCFLIVCIGIATLGNIAYAQEPIEIARWTFDVPVGSMTVPDATGNGYDLNVMPTGGIQRRGISGHCLVNEVQWSAGQSPSAISIETIDETPLDDALASNFTIEGWFRQDSTTRLSEDWATLFIFGINDHGGDATSLLHRTPSRSFHIYLDSANDFSSSIFSFVPDKWHHLALTRNADTGQVKLYTDGKLKAQSVRPVDAQGFDTENDPRIYLLAHPTLDNCGAFPGSVDEMRVWRGVVYDEEFEPQPPLNAARSWLMFE